MTKRQRARLALGFALQLVAGSAVAMAMAELEPCENPQFGPRALCGSISVLEDRTRPDGRRIDLNVAVLRADEPAGREPVFLLAGGPGQAATDIAGVALGPLSPVLETRDFVLVDQRGTGRSNPLLCPNGSAENPPAAFGQLFDLDQMAGCLEEFSQRAEVSLYTNPHVVADLEEVREWLGYERVVLWGGSGGTRVALVWMREHPERVAAALIDGVTPTSARAPSGMARAAQDALDLVFEDCAAQESCHAAYPDLREDFARLLARFDAGPVPTQVEGPDGAVTELEMNRNDFIYAVRGILYRAQRIASLPRWIHEAAVGGDVRAFAQAHWSRDAALRPVISMGVHFAVYCSEDLPFVDAEAAAALDAGTFLGDYLLEQYGSVCELWDAAAMPEAYLEPTRAAVPTLIFSGAYDPSTPASLGDEVARHLPQSRHVIVRDQAHGAEFGCGRPAAIRFLQSATLEGLGPVCEGVGPIEFEVPDAAVGGLGGS